MEIQIIGASGFETAMYAMRLSFNSKRNDDSNIISDKGVSLHKDDITLAKRLLIKGDSHAKATRMIQVWMEIKAPRYWWAEFSTYKIGNTEMSESTVHTILKRELQSSDFEGGMPDEILWYLNDHINNKDFMAIKSTLPESFLQTRVVNMNYQTLRHIYFDRRYHTLPEWGFFITKIKEELPFSELITAEKESKTSH